MNKNECKKYIRKAFNKVKFQGKDLTPKNLEIEMKNIINNESRIYIAYGKMAIHNLNKSANKITIKELTSQIDIIPQIYSEIELIKKAESM